MSEFKLVAANEVEPSELEKFLRRAYGPVKGGFLWRHGAWWYRGDQNRMAIVWGDQMAGYCAVISTRLAKCKPCKNT